MTRTPEQVAEIIKAAIPDRKAKVDLLPGHFEPGRIDSDEVYRVTLCPVNAHGCMTYVEVGKDLAEDRMFDLENYIRRIFGDYR